MRKNILFIAKFNDILKGTNALLAKTFNMQMCPPEPGMIERTLEVLESDLILFYISGLSASQLKSSCDFLEKKCSRTPLVVFGTVDECEDFSYCFRTRLDVKKYIHRPTSVPEVEKILCELLAVEPDVTLPSIEPNMSIADFATSLEETDDRHCILVVDDSGVILRAMKMLLEKKYKVNLANSGKSALESIERERPDAVLLDYEMPVLDGKQTLESIRQNPDIKDLPVFFLTGVSDRSRIQGVIQLNPQGYFLKNSEPSIILGKLDDFFKNLQK